MSGTDETNKEQLDAEKGKEGGQPGADAANEEIQNLKQQIADLRKESAKYRTTAKAKESEKLTIEQQLESLQNELKSTKQETIRTKYETLLEKAGCIKSDLVAKEIPLDCEDAQSWINSYKKENEVLFKKEPKNHGGGYKPSGGSNLTPNQQMNEFIRNAAGRN